MDSRRSFYRLARRFPPADEEYLTLQGRQGPLPATALDEVKRSGNAPSASDSEARARRVAKRRRRLGTLIVRYDVPGGAGIGWEKTLGPGHFNLRGPKEELKRCLSDFVASVQEAHRRERAGDAMNYELWDVTAGNGIARFRSDDEAGALVRTLLDRDGDAYAESLDLGIEDDGGVEIEMLSGAALIERARATSSVTG